jgi:hypothetical protein
LVDRRASTWRGVRGHYRPDDSPGRGDPPALHGNAHRKADLPGRIALDAKWYIESSRVVVGRLAAVRDELVASRASLQARLWLARGNDQPRRTPERRSRALLRCSFHPNGWRNGRFAGASPVRSTNPRS